MSDKLIISIVVPAYNSEATIAQCIEALENQSLERSKYEIIVVDNNSTDATRNIITKFPDVFCLSEKKQGSASARNAGVFNSSGEIIAFTDADCVPDKHWLERITKNILTGNFDVCGGEVKPVSVDKEIERFGEVWFWPIKSIINGELFHYPYVITANAAYSADLLKKLNGFDPAFPVAGYEDTDLGWRSYFTGAKFCYVPEAVVSHHHRTTLNGLFYMGYKGAFGREILIDKFKSKGITGKNLAMSFLRLVLYATRGVVIKNPLYRKRRWLIYDMTFRTGQLYGSFMGKKYVERNALPGQQN